MADRNYSTFTEAMLAEYIEVANRYHELRDALYGWTVPMKRFEVFGDPAVIERVARLAGTGVRYETSADGRVSVVTEVAGVEFSSLRDRGQ